MISVGVKHQHQTNSNTHQAAASESAFPYQQIRAVQMDLSVVVQEG